MKEDAIKKINKVGHVGTILTKIIKVFLIIGFVGALIGEIVLMWIPSDLFKIRVDGGLEGIVSKQAIVTMSSGKITVSEITEEVDKNASVPLDGTLSINEEEYVLGYLYNNGNDVCFSGTTKAPRDITVNTVRAAVLIAILLVVCSYVMFIFVAKLCKALETCESPFGTPVIDSLNKFSYVLLGYVIVAGFLSSLLEAFILVGNSSVTVGINLPTVLVALAVYVLTVVFKYGAILQQESDETL